MAMLTAAAILRGDRQAKPSTEKATPAVKSVLLHIGPHKTGTTYLQSCFARKRDSLMQRGIVVPASWEHAPGNASHTGLVDALRNGGDLEKTKAILAQAAREGDTLLVSAEDLSTLRAESLARLRDVIGDAAVTIIFYVRRWSDLLPSAWQEQIKQGHTASFPEFLANTLRDPEASQVFNLDIKLSPFSEVFGQGCIKLVCYSVLRDAGRDLFSHFCARFLGWRDAEPPPGLADINAARGVFDIELLRQMNVIDKHRVGRISSAVRTRLDLSRGRVEAGTVLQAMADSRRAIVFNDHVPILRRFHRHMHDKYAEAIFDPGPKNFFFTPKRQELSYIAGDYLLSPGMTDALHRIYDSITPVYTNPL